jgi:prepilin peptidase CpaA
MDGARAYQLGTVGVASLAALFDWRTGRIPNWLTLGALAAALPFHAWMTAGVGDQGPLDGVKWAVLGALACSLPLLLSWRLGWVAGGDVKLVAALGAVGGLSLGLEAVFLAFLSAASYVLLRHAWNGTLWRSVDDALTLLVGRALVRRKKLAGLLSKPRTLTPSASTLRFGPFALAGSLLAFALHGGFA